VNSTWEFDTVNPITYNETEEKILHFPWKLNWLLEIDEENIVGLKRILYKDIKGELHDSQIKL
jgi:hypothetical protein